MARRQDKLTRLVIDGIYNETIKHVPVVTGATLSATKRNYSQSTLSTKINYKAFKGGVFYRYYMTPAVAYRYGKSGLRKTNWKQSNKQQWFQKGFIDYMNKPHPEITAEIKDYVFKKGGRK